MKGSRAFQQLIAPLSQSGLIDHWIVLNTWFENLPFLPKLHSRTSSIFQSLLDLFNFFDFCSIIAVLASYDKLSC